METKADFIGFTFAGTPSSELGIIRTSNGDRFDEQLVPEVKDITVEVPGMHGEYFFGSTYGTRSFEVSFAFDHLTEEQFRKLRKVYGQRQIGELIFDERPYKRYMAKIESPIELSYVCFDEPKRQIVGTEAGDERYGVRWIEKTVSETVVDEETQEETVVETVVRERERIYPYETLSGTERIYKGEGTVTFVCYFPFAKSVYKQLLSTDIESDWAISSGIMTAAEYATVDKYGELTPAVEGETEETSTPATYGMKVYNAGDVDTGFRLYIPASLASNTITLTYSERGNDNFTDILVIDPVELKQSDVGYLIDTNNGLIVGVSSAPDAYGSYTTSGNVYNRYVNSGYFFKIKPSISKDDGATLQIDGGGEGIQIFYDYLYY